MDGVLYGVPYLRSTPVLYYNKTLFEKAGLASEKGPSDWKELASMSKQLADIGVSGYGFVSDIWIYEAFLRCNSGDTVNEDWTRAVFNSQQGVEMTQFLRDGLRENNFKYYSGNNASDAIKTDEVNQKVATVSYTHLDVYKRQIDNCIITINTYSYTIITAHRVKKKC